VCVCVRACMCTCVHACVSYSKPFLTAPQMPVPHQRVPLPPRLLPRPPALAHVRRSVAPPARAAATKDVEDGEARGSSSSSMGSDLEDLEEAAAVASGALPAGAADLVGRKGKRLSRLVVEAANKATLLGKGRHTSMLMDHKVLPPTVSTMGPLLRLVVLTKREPLLWMGPHT
jgi:hypothetical protein